MKNIIIIVVTAAIVLSGGYFIYLKNSGEAVMNGETATSTIPDTNGTSTNSKTLNIGGLEYQITGDKAIPASTSTIEKLNLDTLKRELVFPSNNPPEINKKYETDINKTISELKKNPDSFDNWTSLGSFRKMIGDYDGTIEAWKNAEILQPNNPLTESNLGNLLGYYMKDPVNAEKHYLKSVELGPKDGFWYYQTFLFYKEVMKDDVKAKNIIEKGVKNCPNDIDLANILKSL